MGSCLSVSSKNVRVGEPKLMRKASYNLEADRDSKKLKVRTHSTGASTCDGEEEIGEYVLQQGSILYRIPQLMSPEASSILMRRRGPASPPESLTPLF